MDLIGVECNNCNEYYFTKAQTHKTICPKCESETLILEFGYDYDDKRILFLQECFNDMRDKIGANIDDLTIWNWIIEIDKGYENAKNR